METVKVSFDHVIEISHVTLQEKCLQINLQLR